MSQARRKRVVSAVAEQPALRAQGLADDRPLGVQAYDTLFSAIQSGRLRPGSLVREAELTKRLGMSRTPLREALQRLESEGLLRLESHRGIVISRLDRQGIVELFTAREWGEGAAAALAARNASEAEIATLHQILQLERSAARDPAAGARYNRKLHQTIYGCTRNRFLVAQLTSLTALLALVGDGTRRSPARVREAQHEHAGIVAAIEKGDAKAAERLARQHILAAQRFVLANRIEDEGP